MEQYQGSSKCCPTDTTENAVGWSDRSHWRRHYRRVHRSLYGGGAHERCDPVPEGPHTNIRERIRRTDRRPYRISLKSNRWGGAPPGVLPCKFFKNPLKFWAER